MKNCLFWLLLSLLWIGSIIGTAWITSKQTESLFLKALVEPPIILKHPTQGRVSFRSPTQTLTSYELQSYFKHPIKYRDSLIEGALLKDVFRVNSGVFCIIPKRDEDLFKFIYTKRLYQKERAFINKYLLSLGFSDKSKFKTYWGIAWTDLKDVKVSFFKLPQRRPDSYEYIYHHCASYKHALITKGGWIR